MEEVPEVLPVWQVFGGLLVARGYSVWVGKVNATAYGVPQTRGRGLLLASLERPMVEPPPTHSAYVTGRTGELLTPTPGLLRAVTISDTLGWPRDAEIVSNYGTGGDPKRRGRRRGDQPAATITSKAGRNRVLIPGQAERRLTAPEAAALQTFGPYPWRGTRTEQWAQIGNAVPPLLAAHAAAALLGVPAP